MWFDNSSFREAGHQITSSRFCGLSVRPQWKKRWGCLPLSPCLRVPPPPLTRHLASSIPFVVLTTTLSDVHDLAFFFKQPSTLLD